MSNNSTYRPGGWTFGNIVRDLSIAWRLLWDPAVPALLKFSLPVLALLYWISPLDLLPGLPFDDLAVLLLAARLFVAMAPPDSVQRAYYGGTNSQAWGRTPGNQSARFQPGRRSRRYRYDLACCR